jgi:predicted RNase H-like nuclease (RuvC/YqgF family)
MDPVKTCCQVLEHIRHNNLNFVFRESPFGVFISIMKSFRKNTSHDTTPPAHSAVQIYVEENSDTKVNVAKEEAIILIKDLKSTIKSLEEENKNIINSLEGYRLSDKKLLTELKLKDKEIYNISRHLEKEKDRCKILAMEIKDLKCKLAQE